MAPFLDELTPVAEGEPLLVFACLASATCRLHAPGQLPDLLSFGYSLQEGDNINPDPIRLSRGLDDILQLEHSVYLAPSEHSAHTSYHLLLPHSLVLGALFMLVFCSSEVSRSLSTQGLITCYSVCMHCPGPKVTTLKTANSRVQALIPQRGCQAGVAGAWHGGLGLRLVGRWLLVV